MRKKIYNQKSNNTKKLDLTKGQKILQDFFILVSFIRFKVLILSCY